MAPGVFAKELEKRLDGVVAEEKTEAVMTERPYLLKLGDPAIVFTSGIAGVSRSPCNLMRDTDHDTEAFVIGRIHGDPITRAEQFEDRFDGYSIVTPSGVVVSATAVEKILGIGEQWICI
jgi:hypothetical protein